MEMENKPKAADALYCTDSADLKITITCHPTGLFTALFTNIAAISRENVVKVITLQKSNGMKLKI